MAETRARRSPTRKPSVPSKRTRATKSPRAECSVAFCPICTALTTMQDVRPEVVQHLMAASRELLLAARSFIDARVDTAGSPARLEKIDIA